jgi:hypothetical protein
MIKASFEDIQNLKKLIPKNHLIIATTDYRGWRNVLGFLAQFVVNPVQWLTKPRYDNKRAYISHVFTIFYEGENLSVGEMDFKNNWKENRIRRCNTFLKMTTGKINIFDLGIISQKEFSDFLEHARKVKYPKLGAIASKKLFWFLKPFRSKKSLREKRHCSSIFARYEPFSKYFKTTGERLLKAFGTHHPEAIDFYLNIICEKKVIKVKKQKIKWNI